jgi:hypothetical protein
VSFAEIAPALYLIAASGIVAGGIVLLFRQFGPRRKVSDEYISSEDHTKWVYVNGRKVPPIAPDQLAVYTGTARVHAIEGKVRDAEVVSYEDERTRLVRR